MHCRCGRHDLSPLESLELPVAQFLWDNAIIVSGMATVIVRDGNSHFHQALKTLHKSSGG